jgi:D-glycero-D-manno-heptose 1,7-bisphosphate phosphatase
MCKCRKPLPGLIFFAKEKWDIDLSKSIMIGDTEKDYFAAKNSNVEFYLLKNIYIKNFKAVNTINDISEIINKIN